MSSVSSPAAARCEPSVSGSRIRAAADVEVIERANTRPQGVLYYYNTRLARGGSNGYTVKTCEDGWWDDDLLLDL